MCHRGSIAGFSILLLLTIPASATTYVQMTDDALLDASQVVALGRVLSLNTGVGPFTEYELLIERALKGGGPARTLRFRIPGGTDASGMTLRIAGLPELPIDRQAIFCLSFDTEGNLVPTGLGLGIFLRGDALDGEPLAVRLIQGSRLVDPDGRPAVEPLRHFDRFANWIAARSLGSTGPSYLLDLETRLQTKGSPFTLTGFRGLNLRWEEFDRGTDVPFFADRNGQPGMPGGGFREFQRGLDAWNAEPRSAVRYVWRGRTDATGGFTRFDGVNEILFDNPNNLAMGTYTCGGGGVLSLGGVWFSSSGTHRFARNSYLSIRGADIVTNKNAGCFFAGNGGKDGEEVFAHELGHTLGIAHSCGDAASGPCDSPTKDDALMRSYVHGDGRGAQLEVDDRSAAAYLYGSHIVSSIPTLSEWSLLLLSAVIAAVGWSNTQIGS